MNFCTSSDPDTRMKVHSVWWATALASKVFPVPGGPYSNTPYTKPKCIPGICVLATYPTHSNIPVYNFSQTCICKTSYTSIYDCFLTLHWAIPYYKLGYSFLLTWTFHFFSSATLGWDSPNLRLSYSLPQTWLFHTLGLDIFLYLTLSWAIPTSILNLGWAISYLRLDNSYGLTYGLTFPYFIQKYSLP